MNNRKYAVPFPCLNKNETVDDVISFFKNYGNNIDHFYLGVSGLANSFHDVNSNIMTGKSRKVSDDAYYEFLLKSEGVFKRVITINSAWYGDEYRNFVDKKLIPFIDKYDIDGVILTDFNMACSIHKSRPDVELQTSCNCFIETVAEMNRWNEYAGVTVFNPPREYLRMPGKLKELRETGYKLKYLVNEACLFGCPQRHNHFISQSICDGSFKSLCYHGDSSNIFRSTFIVPRWQRQLDPYVDVYKISGRLHDFNFVKNVFLAYYNELDDVDVIGIMDGAGGSNQLYRNQIMASYFNDKLLSCECKQCETCGICYLVINKVNVLRYYEKDFCKSDYERLRDTMIILYGKETVVDEDLDGFKCFKVLSKQV